MQLTPNKEAPQIKKGDTVKAVVDFYMNSPEISVTAFNDSDFNDIIKKQAFSCKLGGDMMFHAKWNGHYWIIN